MAAILDFWRTSTSHEIGSTTIRKLDPEKLGVAVGILSLCALELEICLGVFLHLLAGKRRKKPLLWEGVKFADNIHYKLKSN